MDESRLEDTIYRVLVRFYQNVLLPKFATKEDVMELKAEIGEVRSDLDEVKESLSRLGDRVDLLAEDVTVTKTDHERRLQKVEQRFAVES